MNVLVPRTGALSKAFPAILQRAGKAAFIGMPKTPEDAAVLAELDKFKFERWAVSLVDGTEANKRQRGDQGIDGKGRFPSGSFYTHHKPCTISALQNQEWRCTHHYFHRGETDSLGSS